jgi:hypothetical protein
VIDNRAPLPSVLQRIGFQCEHPKLELLT